MADRVEFRTRPSQYRHWKLSTDGAVATLAMDVDETGGLVEKPRLLVTTTRYSTVALALQTLVSTT